MNFQTFKNQWLDHTVDYDRAYGFQCVDLIKQYLHQVFGLNPGAWGNAIDYWRHTAAPILARFDKVESTNPQAGEVVILNGLHGNPYGHIVIATGNQNTHQFEALEQNGSTGNGKGQGGDKIRTRFIDKSRIAGVLRPKGHSEAVKNGQTWFVRSQPNTAGQIIGAVARGQVFDTQVVGGDWRQINLKGKVGFVGPAAWR